MSISIHSETSKDEIETEDGELEDLVWNLMSRTGLLSQIQGRISKFIEDNGKVENVQIYPERADKKILGFIFEYLQWVGMKQTNSVLLSESPVEVDVSIYESRQEGSEYKPEICKLFEELNMTDKGSPTRSNNYSRDEFEDSRLTSASEHPSIKSVEDEASHNDNGSEEEGESYSSHKISRRSTAQQDKTLEKTPNSKEMSREVPEELANDITENEEKSLGDIADRSGDMISFNSPAIGATGFSLTRPNVTLRQRFENNIILDPFQSPVGISVVVDKTPLDAVPIADSNNRLSFVPASNSLEEILGDDRIENAGSPEILSNDRNDNRSVSKQDVLNQKDNISQQESIKKNHEHKKQSIETKDPSLLSQDEDQSTSDFMETLTMEDDTQDVSIDSDAKGMSSCEHAVNLK